MELGYCGGVGTDVLGIAVDTGAAVDTIADGLENGDWLGTGDTGVLVGVRAAGTLVKTREMD